MNKLKPEENIIEQAVKGEARVFKGLLKKES